MTFRVDTLSQNDLRLENNEFNLSVNQSAYIYANQTIQLTTGVGNIQITADDNNSSQTWYFTAQGYLQFPQGLGPTSSKGKEGDEAGSVVFDGDYIYYCHTDYTGDDADIWKRVQWTQTTW
jgi:phosphodiesterase/alkaline phosphatase D-like protein